MLGKLTAADNEKVRFADDLQTNMANADSFSRSFREGVDALVARKGIDAPLPTAEELEGEPPEDEPPPPHVPALDLRKENVIPWYGRRGSLSTSPGSIFPCLTAWGIR